MALLWWEKDWHTAVLSGGMLEFMGTVDWPRPLLRSYLMPGKIVTSLRQEFLLLATVGWLVGKVRGGCSQLFKIICKPVCICFLLA